MPESSHSTSVTQGFNFEKDSQDAVGHITYLKIGEQEYASDLNVTNPEMNSEEVKVFGVMENIYWEGGYADPVQFSCQVAAENKNNLATLVHTSLSNTEVLFEFDVFEYDPQTAKYFKCFHSNGVQLKGLIYKQGGELAIQMGTEENGEIVSPKNFTFTLGVMPQDEDQAIHIAVSTDGKFAKKWGVAVAA